MLRSKIITQRRSEAAYLALIALLVCLVTVPFSCACAPDKAVMLTETYIVQAGDTLDAISYKYMAKNDYGPRDVREFREGIIELNWDKVFAGRVPHGLLMPGDKLQINYWAKGGESSGKH